MEKKQILLILKGLPASGKSTWAKKFVKNFPNYVRINRDDLRNMRGRYWLPKQENLITAMENACIIEALNMGFNVVLDATNLNDDLTNNRIELLKSKFNGNWNEDVKVKIKFFDVDVQTCIERDKNRNENEQVGEDVILRMSKKLNK